MHTDSKLWNRRHHAELRRSAPSELSVHFYLQQKSKSVLFQGSSYYCHDVSVVVLCFLYVLVLLVFLCFCVFPLCSFMLSGLLSLTWPRPAPGFTLPQIIPSCHSFWSLPGVLTHTVSPHFFISLPHSVFSYPVICFHHQRLLFCFLTLSPVSPAQVGL